MLLGDLMVSAASAQKAVVTPARPFALNSPADAPRHTPRGRHE
jgi:hypothetical protein